MIVFTAGGSLYEAFAAQFACRRSSLREKGPAALAAELEDGDVLVHNAANLNPASIEIAVQDNFILTRDLMTAIAAAGKNIRLLFISSMSILGPEAAYKDPLEMNAYSFSKYLAELYCVKGNLDASTVRFSTLFYKNPARDGLSKMIAEAVATKKIQLINEGVDTRDFLPLETAADYLHRIATQDHRPAIYNLGSGRTVSFRECADIIASILPKVQISSVEKPPSFQYVLSHFNRQDMNKLGMIEVDLEAQIGAYINTLR